MEYRWRTNFFRLKDGVELGTSFFGADVERDEEGRVMLYSISGGEPNWLIGDEVQADKDQLEAYGITVPEGMGSYDEDSEWYEDLYGFALIDQLLAKDEVVLVIELNFYKGFMAAHGYIWKQGGEDHIWINLFEETGKKAVEEYGVSREELNWNNDY